MKGIHKYLYGIAVLLLFAGFVEMASAQTKVDTIEALVLECPNKVCYLDGDLYPNSLPSSINCKSDKSTFSFAVYTEKIYSTAPLKCKDNVYSGGEERYFFEGFKEAGATECKNLEGKMLTDEEMLEYQKLQKYATLDHTKVDDQELSFERYDRYLEWGEGDGKFDYEFTENKPNEIHRKMDGSYVKHLEESVIYYNGDTKEALYHHSDKEGTNLKLERCNIKDVILKGKLKGEFNDITIKSYSDINLVGGNEVQEKPIKPIKDNCVNKENCL